MIEIIREPKVNKRARTLPFVTKEPGNANTAKKANSKTSGAANGDKLNGTSANRSEAEDGRQSVCDEVPRGALEEAKQRVAVAEERVAQLEQESERRFEEARERGFEEGVREGTEEARKEVETASAERLRRLDELCAKMGDQFSEHLESAVQDSVVEVVFAAAGKFIGNNMADRDSIVAIVENMTRNIEASHNIRVRVSPRDFDFLNSGEWVPPKRNGGPRFEFLPDERIELGGCIIETTHGELDARLETQLRRLKEVLIETRSKQLSGASQ